VKTEICSGIFESPDQDIKFTMFLTKSTILLYYFVATLPGAT